MQFDVIDACHLANTHMKSHYSNIIVGLELRGRVWLGPKAYIHIEGVSRVDGERHTEWVHAVGYSHHGPGNLKTSYVSRAIFLMLEHSEKLKGA